MEITAEMMLEKLKKWDDEASSAKIDYIDWLDNIRISFVEYLEGCVTLGKEPEFKEFFAKLEFNTQELMA